MEVLLVLMLLAVILYFANPHVAELKCANCGLVAKVKYEICPRCGHRKYWGRA
jgi:uncharacterized OB-fold protein